MIVDSKDPAEKGIDVTLGTEVIVSMTVRELRSIIRALSGVVRDTSEEAAHCKQLAVSMLHVRENKLMQMQEANNSLIAIVRDIPVASPDGALICPVCKEVRQDTLAFREPCYKCCEAAHGKGCNCVTCHEANR